MYYQDIQEILWDDWNIVEELGSGRFGHVYKICKHSIDKDIYSAVKHMSIPNDYSQVKELTSEGMTSEQINSYYTNVISKISKEIDLMSELKSSANIVNIEDFKFIERKDAIGWDILIRMELLNGVDRYFSGKSGGISDIVKLGIDICKALEICDAYNIIHRDIKPDNIFVNKFGDFKLGDFGIAKNYSENNSMSLAGTPNYMAPEIITGTKYNKTVDIYSLGIVMYRMLNNNRLPFLSTTSDVILQDERNQALNRRMNGEQFNAPVNSTDSLTACILKACAFSPEDRFQNATQFRIELERIYQDLLSDENEPTYNFVFVNPPEITKTMFSKPDDISATEDTPKSGGDKTIKKYKKFFLLIPIVAVFLIISVFVGINQNNNQELPVVLEENTYSQTGNAVNNGKGESEKTNKESKSTSKKENNSKKPASAPSTAGRYTTGYVNYNNTVKKTTKRKTEPKTTKKTTTKKITTKKKRPTKKPTTAKKTTVKKTTAKKTTTAVRVGSIGYIQATAGSTEISVSWGTASNASKYIVTVSGPVNSSRTTYSNSAVFRINGSGTYYFTVTPISANGIYGSSKSTSCRVN